MPISIFFGPTDRAELDLLAEAGVSRVIFGLPSADRDAILPRLDRLTNLMEG